MVTRVFWSYAEAMARLIKLIWRLDYGVAYHLMDRKGAVFRALMTEAGDFWPTAGAGPIPESLVGTYVGPTESRAMSIEPNSCNGSIEWGDGIELNRLHVNDTFRTVSKILEKIFKICEIRGVARAGIRLIVLEGVAVSPEILKRSFSTQIDNRYFRSIEAALGPISDTGFVLEGKSEDETQYKMHFGLTEEKNIRAHLPNFPLANIGDLLKNKLFLDIDLFESQISFFETNLQKWASTKLEKAIECVRACRSIASEE